MRRSFREALKQIELHEVTAHGFVAAEVRWRAERPAKPITPGLLRQARWCAAIVNHAARAPRPTLSSSARIAWTRPATRLGQRQRGDRKDDWTAPGLPEAPTPERTGYDEQDDEQVFA